LKGAGGRPGCASRFHRTTKPFRLVMDMERSFHNRPQHLLLCSQLPDNTGCPGSNPNLELLPVAQDSAAPYSSFAGRPFGKPL
jgi:hypothetical protein